MGKNRDQILGIYGDVFFMDTEDMLCELTNILEEYHDGNCDINKLKDFYENMNEFNLDEEFIIDGDILKEIDQLKKVDAERQQLIKLLFYSYVPMRIISFKEVLNITNNVLYSQNYEFNDRYSISMISLNELSDSFIDSIENLVDYKSEINILNIQVLIMTINLVIDYLNNKEIDYRGVEGLTLTPGIDSGVMTLLLKLMETK